MSTSTGEPRVDLWRQPDGFWRWRWTSGTDDESATALVSHRAFDSYDEAHSSAAEAYPELVPPADEGNRSSPVAPRRLLATVVVAALVVAGRVRRGRTR